jgi:hypothetical protein
MVTSFFSRFWRTIGELYNSKGASVLRYRGRDGKVHYVASSDDPNGGGGAVPVVEVEGDEPEQELAPNTFYKFGEVDSLDLTLGEGEEDVLNIYAYSFTASSSFDASTSTYLPEGVVLNGDFAIEEGQTCEISIQDGRAAFMVWDAPEAESPDAPGEPVIDG